MTELERIKNMWEQNTIAGLLPGVNLDRLPLEESAKLRRAVLNLYKLGYINGFKTRADLADVTPSRRDDLQMQARTRKYWQSFKKLLRSIRARVIRKPHRRFPTEALSCNWVVRR